MRRVSMGLDSRGRVTLLAGVFLEEDTAVGGGKATEAEELAGVFLEGDTPVGGGGEVIEACEAAGEAAGADV